MDATKYTIDQFLSPGDLKPNFGEDAKNHPLFQAIREQVKEKLGGVFLPEKFYGQMLQQISDLLKIDIRHILSNAWLQSAELQKLISSHLPGADIFYLPLDNHQIISEHSPFLEPFINDVPMGRIEFTVTVQLLMNDVSLKIRNLQIFEANIGRCEGNLSLRHGELLLLEKANLLIAENQSIPIGPPDLITRESGQIPDDHRFMPSNSQLH